MRHRAETVDHRNGVRRVDASWASAAPPQLDAGPAVAQDAYPSHAITVINPFRRWRIRHRDAAARRGARADHQAAMVDRNQGRRRGAVGAQVAASAKPDGYTLLSHITSISGFAEVDKLFAVGEIHPPDFIPLARFVADPAC